jgi:hypothetical protein
MPENYIVLFKPYPTAYWHIMHVLDREFYTRERAIDSKQRLRIQGIEAYIVDLNKLADMLIDADSNPVIQSD